MKATLDHIGVAVRGLSDAIAFYRDALGLEVSEPTDVPSERVRAVFVAVGQASIELLEATAPDSAIARSIERRGEGLHHVTLAVDDLSAALAQLKARGVRLVDETPRPGAHGTRVAFVHPSSTGGVLLELKERTSGSWGSRLIVRSLSIPFGPFELTPVIDGFFALDGGAMFGVVPKPLWEKVAPPDERNRIRMAMRAWLVRGGGRTVLVDAGCGDKLDRKAADIYGLARDYNLGHALADAGETPESIDLVDRVPSPLRSRRWLHEARCRGRRGAPISERPVFDQTRRMGRCAAPARAQSRELLR